MLNRRFDRSANYQPQNMDKNENSGYLGYVQKFLRKSKNDLSEMPSQQNWLSENGNRVIGTRVDEFHPNATRTLYVSNLNLNIIAADLRKLFQSFGEIIYVDIISVVKAIRAMDGKILTGNQLKLGFGKSRPTNCIWIGGVVESVRIEKLRTFSNRYGSVNHCVIDRSRQHALVFFQLIAQAQLAVTYMHGSIICGDRLQVDFASRNCQQKFYEHLNTLQLSENNTKSNGQQNIRLSPDTIIIEDDESDIRNPDDDSNIIPILDSHDMHSSREENVIQLELLDDSVGSDDKIINNSSRTNVATSVNSHCNRRETESQNYTQCLRNLPSLSKPEKSHLKPTTELISRMNNSPGSSVISVSSGITISSASENSVANSVCSTLNASDRGHSVRFSSSFSNYEQNVKDDNANRLIYMNGNLFSSNGTKTLFIGNLNNNISDVELKKAFEFFGQILEIDIKNSTNGMETYAIIKYADMASVKKAIHSMDGEKLLGNIIHVAFGKSVETCCIWINGVSELVSKIELQSHFTQFGTVVDCEIDRLKQRALVFFQQITNAQLAVIHMHGYLMKGKKLQVDFASLECQQEFYENLESLSESSGVNSVKCGYISQLSPERAKDITTQGVDTTSFAIGDIAENSYSINPNDPRCNSISYLNPRSTDNFQMGSVIHYKNWNNSVHHTHPAQISRSHEPMSLPLPQFAIHHFNNSLLSPLHYNGESAKSDDSQDFNPYEPNFTERYSMFKKNYDEWNCSKTSASNINTCVRLRSKYKLIDNVNNLEPSDIMKSILAKPSAFNRDTKRLEHLSNRNSPEQYFLSRTNSNLSNVQEQQLRSSSLLLSSKSPPVNDAESYSEKFQNSRYEYIRKWLHSINQKSNEPTDKFVDTFQHQKLNDRWEKEEDENIQYKNVEQMAKLKEYIEMKKATEENQHSKARTLKNTNKDKINCTTNENTIKSILLSSIENVHKTSESERCEVENKISNESVCRLSDIEKNIEYTCIENNSIHFDHATVEDEAKIDYEPKMIHKTSESKRREVEKKNSKESVCKLSDTEKNIEYTCMRKKSIRFDHAIVEDETKKEHESKMILVSKSEEFKNDKNERIQFNMFETKKNTNKNERLIIERTKINHDKEGVDKLDKITITKNKNNKSYIINKIYKKDDVKQTLKEKEKCNIVRFKKEGRKKSLNEHKNSKRPIERRICSLKRRLSDSSEILDVTKRTKTEKKNSEDKNNLRHISPVSKTSSNKNKERKRKRYEKKAENNTDIKKVAVNVQNESKIKYEKNEEEMRSSFLQKSVQDQPCVLSMYDKVKARTTKNQQKQEEKRLGEKCSRLERFKNKKEKNKSYLFHENVSYGTDSGSDFKSDDKESDSDYACVL